MCLGNSPNPGIFSSLPGVKSVLSGEFLLIYPKIFGGPPGVLQRGVLRPAKTRNIAAEAFRVNVDYNVAWVSKREGSKTCFISETQILSLQDVLLWHANEEIIVKHSKSGLLQCFPNASSFAPPRNIC